MFSQNCCMTGLSGQAARSFCMFVTADAKASSIWAR